MHRLQSSPAVRALTARFSGRLSAAADAARADRGRTGLHIRWGRTALFLAALVALLVFLVAGLAAAFGAGTLALAGWSLLFAVAGLAGLRALAVRDRTRRARPAAVVAPERRAGAGRALVQAVAREALAAEGAVVEGVATAGALLRRAAGVELPVCAAVAALVAGALTLDGAIAALLARARRDE